MEEGKLEKELKRIRRDNNFGFITVLSCALLAAGASIFNYQEIRKMEERTVPKEHVENIFAGGKSERFYIIDGDTTYVSIDGQPVQDYFQTVH